MTTSRRLLWGAGLTLLLLSPSLGSCADQKAGGRTEMNVVATAAAGPVELGATPVRVPLVPTAKGKPLASLVNALSPGQHLYLVLRSLRVGEQPGVLYHLDLGLPAGATPGKDESLHVGVLNFYNASMPGTPDNPTIFQSYDVTAAARALQKRGMLSDGFAVTIYPVGSPAAGSKASIGRVELAVQ